MEEFISRGRLIHLGICPFVPVFPSTLYGLWSVQRQPASRRPAATHLPSGPIHQPRCVPLLPLLLAFLFALSVCEWFRWLGGCWLSRLLVFVSVLAGRRYSAEVRQRVCLFSLPLGCSSLAAFLLPRRLFISHRALLRCRSLVACSFAGKESQAQSTKIHHDIMAQSPKLVGLFDISRGSSQLHATQQQVFDRARNLKVETLRKRARKRENAREDGFPALVRDREVKGDLAMLGGWRNAERGNSAEIEELARFAVQEHNKKENTLLKLVRVVKAKEQVVAGIMHHFTLEVMEAGQKKLYEAKVWVKPWLHFKQLQEFKHVTASSSFTPSDLEARHGNARLA